SQSYSRTNPTNQLIQLTRRKLMAIFFQLLIAGIATGAIYALVAVGFALLWQTSGTINFAQGEFIMVPAFVMLGTMSFFKIGLLPAFIITLAISLFFFGYVFKRL